MINDCIDCPVRIDCNNCDKELTCEEFKAYMREKEEQEFLQLLTECNKEGTLQP